VIDRFVNWLDVNPDDGERPLSTSLRFFRTVHFARIGETELTRWAWIIVSFIPTLILITGFILWWRRVVRRWLKRTPAIS
jgi:uncharacterized iron-regulated membrane protein